MKLYLVRHGQTGHNRDGLGLGRDDVALTELGLHQAHQVGEWFVDRPLDRVLTSPLQRAHQVAECIAAGRQVPVEVRPELTELDVGETEGLSFAQMREKFPDFLRQWASADCSSARMPSGECLDDVDARIAPLVEELFASTDEAVALVSHNFVVKLFICRLMALPPASFRSFTVDIASISTFQLRSGRAMALGLNDTCHLTS